MISTKSPTIFKRGINMIIKLGTSKGSPVLWDGKNIVVMTQYPLNKVQGFRIGVIYKRNQAIKYCYAHLNNFREVNT